MDAKRARQPAELTAPPPNSRFQKPGLGRKRCEANVRNSARRRCRARPPKIKSINSPSPNHQPAKNFQLGSLPPFMDAKARSEHTIANSNEGTTTTRA